MAARSGQAPLAEREPARNHVRRHRDSARTHPRVSFYLAVPGVRRIAREREREPPGGHATCREKHRRITGRSQSDIPSLAPKWHRRGTLRRHLRLRSTERKRETSSTAREPLDLTPRIATRAYELHQD